MMGHKSTSSGQPIGGNLSRRLRNRSAVKRNRVLDVIDLVCVACLPPGRRRIKRHHSLSAATLNGARWISSGSQGVRSVATTRGCQHVRLDCTVVYPGTWWIISLKNTDVSQRPKLNSVTRRSRLLTSVDTCRIVGRSLLVNKIVLVSNNHKYDRRLSSLLHDQLHWLDVPERVEYKLAVMVRRCLENDQSSEVLERPLHSGYRRQQPTSTISRPASADCTALLEDYIWPSSFLCCRPDGLKLTSDRVSQSVRQFWRL